MATVQVNISGGEKLHELLRRFEAAKAKHVVAGVLAGATNDRTGKPVAEYALYNEYGTRDIPARPFFRRTVARETDAWQKTAQAALNAGMDFDQTLEMVGRRMVDDIQATIMSNMPPPNAPGTQARKAPGAPTLYDTGSLAHSIDWEIREGKGGHGD